MIWLAWLILAIIVFAMCYKLWREDEAEYWRQLYETPKNIRRLEKENDDIMIEYRKVGKELKDSIK